MAAHVHVRVLFILTTSLKFVVPPVLPCLVVSQQLCLLRSGKRNKKITFK